MTRLVPCCRGLVALARIGAVSTRVRVNAIFSCQHSRRQHGVCCVDKPVDTPPRLGPCRHGSRANTGRPAVTHGRVNTAHPHLDAPRAPTHTDPCRRGAALARGDPRRRANTRSLMAAVELIGLVSEASTKSSPKFGWCPPQPYSRPVNPCS